MPRLALSPVPPERADADLLVLPVAAGDGGPVAPPVTAAVLERLGADLGAVAGGAGRFTGALDDVLLLPGYGAVAAAAVLLVGVGPDAGRSPETLRRAAAVAVGAAGKAATMAVALHRAGAGPAADGAALAAVAEGTVLAAYRFQRHKSAPDPGLAAATLLVDGKRSLAAAEPVLRRAEVAARATLAARDLVNEPASRINPATLAAEAVRLAKAAGLEHKVLTGPALRRGRFGAVAAVGGGSATAPRLVELRYRPPRGQAARGPGRQGGHLRHRRDRPQARRRHGRDEGRHGRGGRHPGRRHRRGRAGAADGRDRDPAPGREHAGRPRRCGPATSSPPATASPSR